MIQFDFISAWFRSSKLLFLIRKFDMQEVDQFYLARV